MQKAYELCPEINLYLEKNYYIYQTKKKNLIFSKLRVVDYR
jgi:hypothetical protein